MLTLKKAMLAGVLVMLGSFLCLAQEFPEVAVAQTLIYLNSQPGDWVGGGQQYMFTPADGTFYVTGTLESGIDVAFHTPDYSHWFYLDFGPASAHRFTKGQYVGAQRFAFHSPTKPGIDVSGDGRGCNTDAGQFLLEEMAFNPDGSPARFAVDFEQHCEGAPPALFGSVRYNSKVSLVPRFGIGDATLLKGNAGTNGGSVVLALSMPSTSPVSVQYSTKDGSGLQGIDYVATSGTATFAPGITTQIITVPIVGDRTTRGNKTFGLTLANASGAPIGDGASKSTILSPNGPVTALSVYGDPGDFINPGQQLLTNADGAFILYHFGDQSVSITLDAGDYWDLSFAAPDGNPLVPGDYENAQRYPFQPPGVPGLDVDGHSRGCNTLTGRFSVLKAVYDPSGNVQHFSADFEQHCEGAAPALRGSVRFKSPLRQMSISDAVVSGGSATFTITLNPSSSGNITVGFATIDGNAIAGIDYSPVAQTVTFAHGETSHVVSVPILKMGTGKQFFGTLVTPSGAPLWISQSTATIQ